MHGNITCSSQVLASKVYKWSVPSTGTRNYLIGVYIPLVKALAKYSQVGRCI